MSSSARARRKRYRSPPPRRRRLFAGGHLRALFQPIDDVDTGAVVGSEALARGPAGTALEGPDALFSAAGAAGLVTPLDEACRLAGVRGALAVGCVPPLTLFVNVEPEAVDAPALGALTALGPDARALRVVVEINERAVAARPAELLSTVERIRSHGWQVALDDVGADPESLAFTALLRPEVVKLDLALVHDRPGPVLAGVMHAVNAYAERAGALVLAEGVETAPPHLAVARSFGARLAQGWLFGRPGPALCGRPVADAWIPLRGGSRTQRTRRSHCCRPARRSGRRRRRC